MNGLFASLRRLFGRDDPLLAAAKSGDAELFARRFRETELFIISIPFDESLDPSTMEREEYLELLEQSARAAAESEQISPLILHIEDAQYLPVFTSMKASERFVQDYVQQINRIQPFLTGSIEGVNLVPLLLDGSVGLVLDAGNPGEYRVPDELLARLGPRD